MTVLDDETVEEIKERKKKKGHVPETNCIDYR
jgi:hypothetical protein